MDNYNETMEKTKILIDDYIFKHKIGDYIQNITFDRDLNGYACYNYITKQAGSP